MAGDRVQFAIDIAAQMTGGDVTAKELDAVSAQLMGGGKNAEHFQQAIKRVSSELDGAKLAATQASDALAEGERKYSQLEKAAVRAQQAFEKASRAGRADAATMARLASAASDAEFALLGEARALDVLRAKSKAADTQVVRLDKTLRNLGRVNKHVTNRLGDAATKLSTFRGALGDVGGPVGELGEKLLFPVQAFVDLNEWFGRTAAIATVVVIGITAVAAAVVALGAAAAGAVGYVAALGVKLADTNRSAKLANEALAAAQPELEGLKMSAEQFTEAFKDGTLELSKFSAATQAKLGGLVSRQLLGLDAQAARLKKNLGEVFGGLEIEPLLMALSNLVDLFDKNTAAGQTLKFLFEGVFQPIVDGATEAAYVVEAFFLGILIGGLKIYIGLKPAIKAVKEFLGVDDSTTFDWLTGAKDAGELVAAGLVALAAVFGLVIGVVTAALAIFLAVPIALAAIGNAIGGVIADAINFLRSVDLAEIGKQMMTGLANGIKNAASAVWNAITGAVKGAIDGAKRLLGIASPSKVFMGLGEFTGEGFAAGVEAENDNAQGAIAKLVEPPSLTSLASESINAGESVATGGAPGGASINLQGATFNFYGVEGAETVVPRLADALTSILEGDAAQISGGVAA